MLNTKSTFSTVFMCSKSLHLTGTRIIAQIRNCPPFLFLLSLVWKRLLLWLLSEFNLKEKKPSVNVHWIDYYNLKSVQ